MKSKCITTLPVLMAVFALSALTATSASATLPEFNPKPTNIKNPITFTTGGRMAVAAFGGGPNVVCSSSKGTGTITAAKSGTVKLTLEGCRGSLGEECYSSGQKGATIVTESLPFVLVYTTKEPTKQVALDFGKSGSTFMKYWCGGNATMRGRMLAPLTPLNTLTKTFEATLSAEKGAQTPTKNYNEELTGTEESFPEISWKGEEAFTRREATLTGKIGIQEFKQSGLSIEEKIEA